MLTGEYSVLRGVPALAVPTRAGQRLEFTPSVEIADGLLWQAYDTIGQLWLEATFDAELNLEKSWPSGNADLLARLLSYAFGQAAHFPIPAGVVRTHLEFDARWGWGSSSSLVALIAHWSGCPLMELYRAAFRGSGYDAAVGYTGKPLVYRLDPEGAAHWQEFALPEFWRETYLLYRGQKQDSQREVARFAQKESPEALLSELRALSLACLQASTLTELCELLQQHEKLTGALLDRRPVQEELFPDFPGVIKSLGAWGGDYLWVLSPEDPLPYFQNKSEYHLEPFSEIVAV